MKNTSQSFKISKV